MMHIIIFLMSSLVRELKRMVRNIMLSSNDTLVFLNILKSKKQPPMPCINGEAVPREQDYTEGEFSSRIRRRTRRFLGKESCHVFAAGYLACASAIWGLFNVKDLIFADKNLPLLFGVVYAKWSKL